MTDVNGKVMGCWVNTWCMANKYTKEEEDTIRNNYEMYGPKYCAKLLNRDADALYAKAKRMKLKKTTQNKHPSMQKINPEQFINIMSKEVVYFLGFMWADGYILYRQNKTSHNYTIALEIKSEDAINILPILNSLGKWAISKRKRRDSWQETTIISTNSKDIYHFLKDNEYNLKSLKDPTTILEKIPDHLRVYWWRGFFDGDGCISFGKYPEKWKSLSFSSTFNYKWTELINLSGQLNVIKYSIQNYTHKIKNHSSSRFMIQNKKDITKFVNFLLTSEIGLLRKTEKLEAFLLRHNTKNPK